jgi:two-component system, sensor histidine kinase PdtaS
MDGCDVGARAPFVNSVACGRRATRHFGNDAATGLRYAILYKLKVGPPPQRGGCYDVSFPGTACGSQVSGLAKRPAVLPSSSLPAITDSLGLAIVAASTVPLLLMAGDATIIAASLSFVQDFDLDAEAVIGQSLYAIAGGAWNLPRLRSLLAGTISGQVAVAAYEIDLALPVLGRRRLILNAHRLVYAGASDDAAGIRLMLALTDVTDARANDRIKDDLIREKAELMLEIQHRVANSLQIIASVLMQSARRVSSEESRLHLRDAHSRVMAIAELQRQLAESGAGDVAIGPYLDQLCLSLGASMIADHDKIQLVTHTDASRVIANTSVSIGLIVTELVINSLKHAFPNDRQGRISVDFTSDGADWRLVVADDGIGMKGADDAVAGLGTNIVNALARHLNADVRVSDAGPGTRVELVHRETLGGTLPTGISLEAAV